MVNISTVNSYIIFSTFSQNPLISRFNFKRNLAMDRVKPQLEKRLGIPNLPRDLRRTLQEFFGNPQEENVEIDDKLPKRKTCSKCPSSKLRKTAYKCVVCLVPICLKCSRKICVSFYVKDMKLYFFVNNLNYCNLC